MMLPRVVCELTDEGVTIQPDFSISPSSVGFF